MSLKSRIVVGAIATASLSIGSALYAADAPTDVINGRTTVRIADLNLDRAADVAVLYERINLAAQQVCHQRALNGAYVLSPRYDQCVGDTVDKVIASINRVSLTAFARQHQQMRLASAAAF
jgi:UrcA family protein